MELNERIQALVEAYIAGEESLADAFVVDIVLAGNRLNVFMDADSGITFDKCKKISRHLEAHLDAEGWLGEKYVLEVSSPGIGRPLKFVRQYVKNIGRSLVVSLTDHTQQEGVLKSADEQQIVLEQDVVEKEGNRKVKKKKELVLPLDQIEKAVVRISF